MPAMHEGPSSYPDKGTAPGRKKPTTTSSEESSSILKRSPQHQLEGFLTSTKGIAKCLAKKSHRGYPDTPSGTTPLNYSLGPLHHYLVDSFPSPKAKLLKPKSLWPSI